MLQAAVNAQLDAGSISCSVGNIPGETFETCSLRAGGGEYKEALGDVGISTNDVETLHCHYSSKVL